MSTRGDYVQHLTTPRHLGPHHSTAERAAQLASGITQARDNLITIANTPGIAVPVEAQIGGPK